MVSKLTQSLSLTSHAYESALTQTLPSQPRLHLTLGHFHKMVTSFATRDCSMSPTIRTSDWTSWHHQDDQEYLSPVLLALNGHLHHQLHPIMFSLPLQQVPPPQALWPPSFPTDRRMALGFNINGF